MGTLRNGHTLDYCPHCEAIVVLCGKCGNNTCNGGHGEVDGKPCDMCDDAYAAMKEYDNDPHRAEQLAHIASWDPTGPTEDQPTAPGPVWVFDRAELTRFVSLIIGEVETANATKLYDSKYDNLSLHDLAMLHLGLVPQHTNTYDTN